MRDNTEPKLVFTTQQFTVAGIKKRTRAKGFCDLRIGDTISFCIVLDRTTGHSGGGVYASDVQVHNVMTGDWWVNTQNVFLNNVRNFELR